MALKGQKITEEHRRKLYEGRSKFKYSKRLREKMAKIKETQFKNGTRPWNEGKKMTDEYKRNVSKTLKGRVGEKSRNWKGGLTPIFRVVRNSFIYRQWRSDILFRDDFICQICNIRGGILQVDHFPISFAKIIYENNIKTMQEALDCEELWNINNGRTLCLACHKKTENYLKRYKVDYGILEY